MCYFQFKALLFLNIFILSVYAAGPMSDYYVTPSGGVSASCQISQPCSFQTALDLADGDGISNTIHVGAGTYTLSGTSLAFSIQENKSLTIEGANSATTIIDGNLSTRLFKIYSSVADSDVHITIRNLTFKEGSTSSHGNGLYVSHINDGTITLEDNRFLTNGNNDGFGGGVYIDNYYGNTMIKRNIFRDNHGDAGGGVYVTTDTGRIDVIDNEFTNNSVSSAIEHNGGGLYTYTMSGIVVAANNIFSKNSAINNGAGYYSRIGSSGTAHIINNTLIDNSADLYGGGIYVHMAVNDASHTNIYNNIVWNNHSLTGDDVYINNNGNISTPAGATCNFSKNLYGEEAIDYYVYKAGSVVNTANIRKNPLFSGAISLPDGRYSIRLFTASPAVDAGFYCVTGVQSTDYEGEARIQGTAINLGAVESVVPIMAPMYYLLLN